MSNKEVMGKIKFLVVDDMKTMRSIVKQALRKLGGASFEEAENGVEAQKILQDENCNIDFVVCDWNMPNMTGIELLDWCRKSDKYKDLAFMLVTAEQDVSQVKEAIIKGVDGYVVKPFDPSSFKTRLTLVLKKRFMKKKAA